MKRHFLTLADRSRRELQALLDRALVLKRAAKSGSGVGATPLKGRLLGLLFEKPSLRTRVTFEVGMRQLGGDSIYLGASEVQLGVRESVADVARNLERWIDGIVLRTFRHEMVEELARHSSIPVINGLTDLQHPCQIFSDLLTLLEKKGRLEGLRVAYIGDGNNVANSWLQGAAIMGMELVVCTPKAYEPHGPILRDAQKIARKSGARIVLAADPLKAAAGADVLYTDVWTSMGQEREAVRRKAAFKSFQINQALVRRAKKDVLVMHCLPAHRGEEITDAVIDGPHSIVFDQAENRLHAQKAILEALMSGKKGKERT
ncbi:MAG: ornithine carbamoyltransferase [bacterium]